MWPSPIRRSRRRKLSATTWRKARSTAEPSRERACGTVRHSRTRSSNSPRRRSIMSFWNRNAQQVPQSIRMVSQTVFHEKSRSKWSIPFPDSNGRNFLPGATPSSMMQLTPANSTQHSPPSELKVCTLRGRRMERRAMRKPPHRVSSRG